MITERVLNRGFADLHTHSRVSDGPYTIEELFDQARRLGIQWLSVTDHDTAAGIRDCLDAASRWEIDLVPGIEITALAPNGGIVHILGYGLRPDCGDVIDETLRQVREQRTEACRQAVEQLNELGFELPWSSVASYVRGTGVFKFHIMHALVSAGYATTIKGSLYRELNAPGGPLSGHTAFVSAALAIGLIHEARGVAVLAHPGIDRALDSIDELLDLGLDGIEAYHPSNSAEVVSQCLTLAGRQDLAVTGGSDAHGFYGDHDLPLGCPDLTREDLEDLLERIEARGGMVHGVTTEPRYGASRIAR